MKMRLHFLALLSKTAQKLRRSQAQAKKLVKKLRLVSAWILPYESSFIESEAKNKIIKNNPCRVGT